MEVILNKVANEAKETFICEECEMIFAYKHTLKRHKETMHTQKLKLYMKHEKVDGKYPCTTCGKTYTHSRELKNQMAKKHLSDF